MGGVFEFADELGPSKIIHVYEPCIGLKAILVVDNVAKGPSIGGLRMAEDVSLQECFRLARAMTYKNEPSPWRAIQSGSCWLPPVMSNGSLPVVGLGNMSIPPCGLP